MDIQFLIKRLTVVKVAVLFWLQIVDLATTLIFMRLGLREANWLVTSANNPIQRMFELKIIFMAYTLWVTIRRYHNNIFQNILSGAVTVYMLVVSWNLYGIMRVMGIL